MPYQPKPFTFYQFEEGLGATPCHVIVDHSNGRLVKEIIVPLDSREPEHTLRRLIMRAPNGNFYAGPYGSKRNVVLTGEQDKRKRKKILTVHSRNELNLNDLAAKLLVGTAELVKTTELGVAEEPKIVRELIGAEEPTNYLMAALKDFYQAAKTLYPQYRDIGLDQHGGIVRYGLVERVNADIASLYCMFRSKMEELNPELPPMEKRRFLASPGLIMKVARDTVLNFFKQRNSKYQDGRPYISEDVIAAELEPRILTGLNGITSEEMDNSYQLRVESPSKVVYCFNTPR